VHFNNEKGAGIQHRDTLGGGVGGIGIHYGRRQRQSERDKGDPAETHAANEHRDFLKRSDRADE
jgi:hypothetical protein